MMTSHWISTFPNRSRPPNGRRTVRLGSPGANCPLMLYLELEEPVRLWRGNTVNIACMPASM